MLQVRVLASHRDSRVIGLFARGAFIDKLARMTKQAAFCLWLLASSAAGFGCASSRQGVRFTGTAAPPIARAHEVKSVIVARDTPKIGTLDARCFKRKEPGDIDGEWLSDVACSEQRLLVALRQKAADVGGTAIANPVCKTSYVDAARSAIRCRADVARLRAEPTTKKQDNAPGVTPSAAALLDDPTPRDSFFIKISYSPEGVYAPLKAKQTSEVWEQARLPVGKVVIGQVSVRCEQQCSAQALRASLRVVAAELGAELVVSAHCGREHETRVCMATLARPEVAGM